MRIITVEKEIFIQNWEKKSLCSVLIKTYRQQKRECIGKMLFQQAAKFRDLEKEITDRLETIK